MLRISRDLFDAMGNLVTGYDYDHQCWVINGIVQECGHPEKMKCGCYGRLHAGEGQEWRKAARRREGEAKS